MIKARGSDLDHIAWLGRLAAFSFEGKRVLDLGCGSGYLCQTAMIKGAHYALGIDIEEPPELNEDSQTNWQFEKIDLEKSDWQADLKNSSKQTAFDTILAFDIIEHLNSPWHFLTNCHKLLSEQGILILTTPNTNSWERLLKPLNWSGATDPQHKTLFNRYSLDFLLSKAGFTTAHQEAPIRKLKSLASVFPQWGGQIFMEARKQL